MRAHPVTMAATCLTAWLVTSAGAQSLVVTGGTLIDGSGRPPVEGAQVVIRNGIITSVGGPSTGGDDNTPVLDARGKFILPGLVDSHIHYRDWETELFLAYGVTTVNDLGNPFHWQTALKRGFNTGRMAGPRFNFCGEVLLPADEAAEQGRPGIHRRGGLIHTPQEASAIVERIKSAGGTCLKLNENFPGELFTALAEAARSAGLSVISHSRNVTDSVRLGITGVEHMEGIAIATASSPRAKEAIGRMHLEPGHKNSMLYQWMDPAEFDRVIRDLVDHGVYVNPTLAFEWKALHPHAREHEADDLRLYAIPALAYVPLDDRLMILGQYHWPDSRSADDLKTFSDGYGKVQQFLSRFVQAGGKIYAGTDSAAATTPGLSLHHEMQLLVDAGLTPMHAIMAATRWGAEVTRLEGQIGSVEPGKAGDLLLLDANPLDDITNTKKIFKVVKDGRVIDRTYHSDYAITISRPGPETKHLYNPSPEVLDVVPPTIVEGTAQTLRVVGRGFVPASVVKLDGRVVDTRWVSASEVAVSLTTQQTAQPGTLMLTVESPKPGHRRQSNS
jgi:hypothetical protein